MELSSSLLLSLILIPIGLLSLSVVYLSPTGKHSIVLKDYMGVPIRDTWDFSTDFHDVKF